MTVIREQHRWDERIEELKENTLSEVTLKKGKMTSSGKRWSSSYFIEFLLR